MREYELTYIIKPDIDAAAVAVVIEKINGFIAAENGTLVKTDVWGMRKLTYAIRRYREGQYYFNIIKLPEDAPARLENRIKLTEDVIRHMLVIAEPLKTPNPQPAPHHNRATPPTRSPPLAPPPMRRTCSRHAPRNLPLPCRGNQARPAHGAVAASPSRSRAPSTIANRSPTQAAPSQRQTPKSSTATRKQNEAPPAHTPPSDRG